jgi:hypothetical protein
MQLWGLSMVRNEADVVEAFVRHNLRFLDGLTVIDHRSRDGTTEILGALQHELSPLDVVADSTPAFFQAERMTEMARRLFADRRADYVLLLDADEFIKVKSRASLERALGTLPPEAHGLARWAQYVPEQFDLPLCSSHFRWRRDFDRRLPDKAVLSRYFLSNPSQYVVSGNHLVDDPVRKKPPVHIRFARDELVIAHLPVRSKAQLTTKIVVSYPAHLATAPINVQQAHHWRALYESLRDGSNLSNTVLRDIACNYGLPTDQWQPADTVRLIDDPVDVLFDQRYSALATSDPLRLLMGFVEDLLRAQSHRGERMARRD